MTRAEHTAERIQSPSKRGGPVLVLALQIRRIDTRRDDLQRALDELRERPSPRGDIVSEEGRRKTLEVFGEPLSPQQVVERICHDVRHEGLPALLRYGAKLDRATLTRESLRVS